MTFCLLYPREYFWCSLYRVDNMLLLTMSIDGHYFVSGSWIAREPDIKCCRIVQSLRNGHVLDVVIDAGRVKLKLKLSKFRYPDHNNQFTKKRKSTCCRFIPGIYNFTCAEMSILKKIDVK